MNHSEKPAWFLIVAFLALILSVPLLQIIHETSQNRWPQALELFQELPHAQHLRFFEECLQKESVCVKTLRPWMQTVQFFALRDGGEKVVIGNQGWLFYEPGLRSTTQRPLPKESQNGDAFKAVNHFHKSLKERGIRLIVLVIPNKESVYPDYLVSGLPPERPIAAETRDFLALCQENGIEFVDVFDLFRQERKRSSQSLYLSQDSHWSPYGMECVAKAVSERINSVGNSQFDRQIVHFQQSGDLVRMLNAPPIAERLGSEAIIATKITLTKNEKSSPEAAKVLVLGDSFMRIYQQDAPQDAGFIAHLAEPLQQPVASIIHDGGASTVVRQELYRHPEQLRHVHTVIWEFVERDLRQGFEGWQLIPLPPIEKGG